ncbi:MAG: hypothetical protein HYV63_11015 [Candidatus Schekmanbacteria bacterium]|nr:hypothetical protein [Candidatus Schekmanbacteria bacterium]
MALEAPQGAQRIAACEAFLAAHPEHEGAGPLMAALVDAYLEGMERILVTLGKTPRLRRSCGVRGVVLV